MDATWVSKMGDGAATTEYKISHILLPAPSTTEKIIMLKIYMIGKTINVLKI